MAEVDAVMQGIGDTLLEPVPDGKPDERRIIGNLWPDTSFVDVGIRGDLSELEGSRYEDIDTFSGELAERRFIDLRQRRHGAPDGDRRLGRGDG